MKEFKVLGLPNQSEILIINVLGIIFQTAELQSLQLQSNLDKVWNIQLNYLENSETPIQYLVAGVVLARTFTLHAFLVFYLIMLWPAIFKEKPILMVPWLVLGLVRCLLLNLFTLLLGEYICLNEAGISLFCLDYVIAQVLDHGLSVYAWISVLCYYKALVESSGSSEIIKDDHSDDSLGKTKSYSLTDLNMEYLCSNRLKNLPGDASIELVIKELSTLHRKRILQDSSKSFDSLLNQSKPKTPSETKNSSSLAERTMKTLGITQGELSEAKEHKNSYLEVLKDLSISDVVEFPPTTKFHQCQSQLEDGKMYAACLHYVKSQLRREQSNQTLCESEIANVTLNDATEGDRMMGGQCAAVFNANLFLQKFALKKNTSKNFGCQVSMLKRGFLQQSRDQLAKKLMFFRTLGLA